LGWPLLETFGSYGAEDTVPGFLLPRFDRIARVT
jgi:hypothetical protein